MIIDIDVITPHWNVNIKYCYNVHYTINGSVLEKDIF